MNLLHAWDAASWQHLLASILDAELLALLIARHHHLEAEGLLSMTEAVVVTSSTTEADLIDAIGWSPFRDMDGRGINDPAYVQPFNYVYRASASYHVAVQIVGNSGAAFELIVSNNADPTLVAICQAEAGE